MTYVRSVAVAACLILVGACTDYATFVTSTDIGLNLDAKTEELNVGYVRTEAFHGPAYPENGAAPSAVGYISADLSTSSPNVKQLYATGDAAELVTQVKAPPTDAATKDTLEGHRRPFFFGTGTNLGLQVGFTGDAPSSVKFGFNREELSIIPMQQGDPAKGTPDKYASVLASINLNDTAVASPTTTHVKPTQFFATGAAARNLAVRDDIRGIFAAQAKDAVAASVTATYVDDDSSKKLRSLWEPDGKTVDKAADTKIKACMTKYNLKYSVPFLMYGGTKAERDVVIACYGV